MKSKKAFVGILSASILSLSAATAFAANIEGVRIISAIDEGNSIIPISSPIDVELDSEIIPINAPANEEVRAYFGFSTGVVKEISEYKAIEGSKIVLIEDENGVEANIIITSDTYVINDGEIKVGDVLTGYFDANAPRIMIYPVQYSAEVVLVGDAHVGAHIDTFDKDLLSGDKTLKIYPSEDTEIVQRDGTAYEGELTNKKLVVFYDISTLSLPAQTNPTKIVVLDEKEIEEQEEAGKDMAIIVSEVDTKDIVVNNNKIEAPSAYINGKGDVMVPLRAISEALGFEVSWNGELQSIMVSKGISLAIGEDYYTYMKTAPISLGAAPELVEGTTFVPLDFFKKVAKMNSAYVSDSEIVINSKEKIE